MDCRLVPREPGAYILLLRVRARVWVRRPRLAVIEPGLYAYVGGAWGPGGLRGRVCRHASTPSVEWWHVDQLLASPHVLLLAAGLLPGVGEEEAAGLVASSGGRVVVEGFGSSDAVGERLYALLGAPPRIAGVEWHLYAASLQEGLGGLLVGGA